MSELKKTWLHALIACALGAALGLLSDGARAMNDEKPGSPVILIPDSAALDVCLRTVTPDAICAMRHADEAIALDVAKSVLARCPDLPDCAKSLAYIKQRWGY